MTVDQEALTEHCLEIAKEMLALNHEFYPFGAFIGKSGIVHPMGIEIESKNIPNNGSLIEQLVALAALENFETYALCYEVSVQMEASENPKDAICVEINNVKLPKVYLPFDKSEETLTFDQVFAVNQ